MTLPYRTHLKNITILTALLFIISIVFTIEQTQKKKPASTTAIATWIAESREELQNELSIWCVENLGRPILDKEPFQNRTYGAPSVNENRPSRLAYSYIKWKESNTLPRQLTPCEHVLITRLLAIIADICREQRITFFMINGTLLGSWRHHDVIPWDEDADLLMPAEDQPRFIKALYQSKGTVVQYTLLPFSNRPNRSFKIFFRHTPCTGSHCAWKFPSVDLIVYYTNTSHLWFSDNPSIQIPLHYIFPLVMRPLSFLWLPAPRAPQKLLPANIESVCSSRYYDHRFEREQIVIKYNCSDFSDVYPFVQRSKFNKSIETLLLGNSIIHTIIYPSFNISASGNPRRLIKQF